MTQIMNPEVGTPAAADVPVSSAPSVSSSTPAAGRFSGALNSHGKPGLPSPSSPPFVDTAAMPCPRESAIAHVTKLATGEPADPSWRVTLHFHPDRLVNGTPVLELMAHDGVYRSQFETGMSNGGLTAYPGGDRWRWESRIFAAAYDDGPASAGPSTAR